MRTAWGRVWSPHVRTRGRVCGRWSGLCPLGGPGAMPVPGRTAGNLLRGVHIPQARVGKVQAVHDLVVVIAGRRDRVAREGAHVRALEVHQAAFELRIQGRRAAAPAPCRSAARGRARCCRWSSGHPAPAGDQVPVKHRHAAEVPVPAGVWLAALPAPAAPAQVPIKQPASNPSSGNALCPKDLWPDKANRGNHPEPSHQATSPASGQGAAQKGR